MQLKKRKRSIKTLHKIKADNLVSKILVPSQRHTPIADQWHKLLTIDRDKVIEFVFHHETNWMDHQETYDYISLPLHLLSFIEPSPHKIRKTLAVKNTNAFIHTTSGQEFKKKRLKIGLFEFTLHLYPNGLTEIQNAFVGYFVELTKIPANVQYFVICVYLFCVQTGTQHKTTLIFREAGDSEGWIWSLCTNDCQSYDALQFGAELEILQIVYKINKKPEHYTHIPDSNCLKGTTYEYEWKWDKLKPILNAMKECTRNKQRLSFLSEHTRDDMFCFAIEYAHDTQQIWFHCKLLQLPCFVDGIRILFHFSLGYPEYRNTFHLDYTQNKCSMKLIEDDMEWLLGCDHKDLECVLRVEIMEEIHLNHEAMEMKSSEKEANVFMKCWHEMNHCLVRYYKYNKKELKQRFWDFVESMQWNPCLISQIVGNGADTKQWRWHLLMQFEPDLNEFPIPRCIEFQNGAQKERFISYLFAYFYHHKKRPSTKKMTRAADDITNAQPVTEFEAMIQKEDELKQENDILMAKENENKKEQNEIDAAKHFLEEDLRDIQQKIKELEIRKRTLETQQNELEMKQNKVRSTHQDIVRQRNEWTTQHNECKHNKERMMKQRQQNIRNMYKQIRKQNDMKLKLRNELRDYIENRNNEINKRRARDEKEDITDALHSNEATNGDLDELNDAQIESDRKDMWELSARMNTIADTFLDGMDDMVELSDNVELPPSIEITTPPPHDSALECEEKSPITPTREDFEAMDHGHSCRQTDDIILNGCPPLVVQSDDALSINEAMINSDPQTFDDTAVGVFMDSDNDIERTESIDTEVCTQETRIQMSEFDIPPAVPWPYTYEANDNECEINSPLMDMTLPPLLSPTIYPSMNPTVDPNDDRLYPDNKDVTYTILQEPTDRTIYHPHHRYVETMKLKLRHSPFSDDIYTASPSTDPSEVDLITRPQTCGQRLINYMAPPLQSVERCYVEEDNGEDDEDPTWDHEADIIRSNADKQFRETCAENQYKMIINSIEWKLSRYENKYLASKREEWCSADHQPYWSNLINLEHTMIKSLAEQQTDFLHTLDVLYQLYKVRSDCERSLVCIERGLLLIQTRIAIDSYEQWCLERKQMFENHQLMLKMIYLNRQQHSEHKQVRIRAFIHMNSGEEYFKRTLTKCKELRQTCDELQKKAVPDESWSDIEKQALHDPFRKMKEDSWKEQEESFITLVRNHQKDQSRFLVGELLTAVLNGTLDAAVEEIITQNVICIGTEGDDGSQVKAFCDSYPPGKRYKKFKIKIDLRQFRFKIYLYPNGSRHSEKGFVQFGIVLYDMPPEVTGVVIYLKLFEKKTNTQYQCTKVFDGGSSVLWHRCLLPLHKCSEHPCKPLEFGYFVQILRIYKYKKEDASSLVVEDHAKNEVIYSKGMKMWHWELEKPVISSMVANIGRNFTSFYHPHPLYSAVCSSLESPANKKQIKISCYLNKLPPQVEKVKVSFGLSTNSPKLHFISPKIKMHTFSYTSTKCTIELTKKQSEKFLSQAKYYSGKFKVNFSMDVKKVYFRGFMHHPYRSVKAVENITEQSEADAHNEKVKTKTKVSSPKRSIKNGKHMKRGGGNHKQRKRNYRKVKRKQNGSQNNNRKVDVKDEAKPIHNVDGDKDIPRQF